MKKPAEIGLAMERPSDLNGEFQPWSDSTTLGLSRGERLMLRERGFSQAEIGFLVALEGISLLVKNVARRLAVNCCSGEP